MEGFGLIGGLVMIGLVFGLRALWFSRVQEFELDGIAFKWHPGAGVDHKGGMFRYADDTPVTDPYTLGLLREYWADRHSS